VDFAITRINNEYSIENIVPKESGVIPYKIADEYAKTFVSDFTMFIKHNSHKNIRVSWQQEEMTIENIIPGENTRKYFILY
jgi:hypothetical protein